MQKILCSFTLLMSFAAGAAHAADREIIFREDSGLTKAEYFLAVGQYSTAIDTANEVLARHPQNADAYAYRGYAMMKLGQNSEAAKNFKKALLLDPNHLGANKYLADIYLQRGDVSRALEQLQVIRMTCLHTDCEEQDALAREIDQYKNGSKPDKEEKKDNKKEE
jgi:tetratricopeptide (TPR) repeat protein